MVKVVLCGDSLVLAALRVSLAAHPALEVVSRGPASVAQLASAAALHPAAIIFDMLGSPREIPLALLERPNLLLIGIDPRTHELLILSGRRVAEPSTRDLADLITSISPNQPHSDVESTTTEDFV
jgi:hypothetical protein